MRSLSKGAAETQRTRRYRREKKRDISRFSLRNLIASAASLLFFSLMANAQTGEITGRVVIEGGAGMPNVTAYLNSASSSLRAASNNQPENVVTDGDGKFKFAGLTPREYSINVASGKGYINLPVPASERTARRTYRPGDNVTFTLVRGAVITGRVTTSTGERMIGVQVRAMMVRDFEGNPTRDVMINSGRLRMTDDRGVYRIYGLAPGTYVVFTRSNPSGYPISAYDGYAPTYHPSSPRETASEITVTIGGEATGVDIRYRGERGYTVSGVVTASQLMAPSAGTSVALYNASTGFQAGTAYVRAGERADLPARLQGARDQVRMETFLYSVSYRANTRSLFRKRKAPVLSATRSSSISLKGMRQVLS